MISRIRIPNCTMYILIDSRHLYPVYHSLQSLFLIIQKQKDTYTKSLDFLEDLVLIVFLEISLRCISEP